MFAFLSSDKMTPFYDVITSFPTIVWSFLLVFCFFYWIVAVMGLIDFDFLDFDIPDGDINATDGLSNVNVLAGLMMKLGLQGVPFPFTMSAITLLGWFISYYICLFLMPMLPGSLLKIIAGMPIFIATLYCAAFITGLILRPLRPIFRAADQEVERNIVGQIAIIRTTRADKSFGEANVADGGAGLVVKVRSYKDETFKRGDRVVLLEYVKEQHIYRIISEHDFNK